MSHITIRWNGEEGIVRVSNEFKELYDVARWDCLKDAIWKLTQIYNKDIKSFQGKGVITMAKKAVKKPVKAAKKAVKLVKKKKK